MNKWLFSVATFTMLLVFQNLLAAHPNDPAILESIQGSWKTVAEHSFGKSLPEKALSWPCEIFEEDYLVAADREISKMKIQRLV